MSDGTDKAALAVAHVFRVHDIEWQDHLIELLRDADMAAFRTLLRWRNISVGWTYLRPGRRSCNGGATGRRDERATRSPGGIGGATAPARCQPAPRRSTNPFERLCP